MGLKRDNGQRPHQGKPKPIQKPKLILSNDMHPVRLIHAKSGLCY